MVSARYEVSVGFRGPHGQAGPKAALGQAHQVPSHCGNLVRRIIAAMHGSELSNMSAGSRNREGLQCPQRSSPRSKCAGKPQKSRRRMQPHNRISVICMKGLRSRDGLKTGRHRSKAKEQLRCRQCLPAKDPDRMKGQSKRPERQPRTSRQFYSKDRDDEFQVAGRGKYRTATSKLTKSPISSLQTLCWCSRRRSPPQATQALAEKHA